MTEKYSKGVSSNSCEMRRVFSDVYRFTDGCLVTLGNPFAEYGEISPLDLTNSLLASSAFPAVFRPRWSQELFPYAHQNHQFIDGGTMDNLPIDRVVHLLDDTSDENPTLGLVARRPPRSSEGGRNPHLAFVASLEPEYERIDNVGELRDLQTYWPSLSKRVKQISYNQKLDGYCSASSESATYMRRFSRPTQIDQSASR